MRMRWSKWFMMAGIIVGGAIVYKSPDEISGWIKRHRFRIEGLEDALRSEVYVLQKDRWLRFDIPNEASLARLVSNASIESARLPKPGTLFPYAIEYQLVGAEQNLISTGVYHFKGEYVVYREDKSGRTVQVNYFLDPGLTPLTGGHWMLNFTNPKLKGARVLQLRLHSCHPQIKEVGVRLYFRKTVPQRKVTYLWNRLSPTQKRNLARGNVYSFEGLNAWERFCLLRYHWPASAPPGVPGHDFTRRTMFIRDDSEFLQVVDEWVPYGIAVDDTHYGLFPLTNSTGLYFLELLKYPPFAGPHVITNLLFWFEWQQQPNPARQLTWSGTNYLVALTNRNGLLMVGASSKVYLRLLLVENGCTNDVTPEPIHLIAFACAPTNPVEYVIEHVDDSPTLFRVDLRRFVEAGKALNPCTVRYELLGRGEEILQTGEVLLTNTVTPYDWLHTREGLVDVTEPQSLCFVLPAQARVVRIVAPKEQVFVNAYSRPSKLARKLRLPEDYLPSTIAPTQPSWFTLRPPDQLKRREAGQTCLVRLQPRFPESDPLILAGLYEWDSFLPKNYEQGHMIFVPIKGGRPVRPETLPYRYLPVAVGVAQQLCLEAPLGQSDVEPALVLICTNDAHERVSVSLDGKTVFTGYLQGNFNEIRLGKVTAGVHQLAIDASIPLSAYLNYLDGDAERAYLKRFCVMTTTNVLEFPYLKQRAEAELLVLRIFSPLQGERQPYQVRVKLNVPYQRAIGPYPEVTILEREAVITPTQSCAASLLQGVPIELDDGQLVFVPVGPDLPPGQYQVQVHISAPPPRWVSLSRTTPGLVEKLTITLEPRL